MVNVKGFISPLLIGVLLGLSTRICAQSSQGADVSQESPKRQVYTGFSGGITLHIGYAFAKDPSELFANNTLLTSTFWQTLPSSGVTLGAGATLRFHLLDHIHVGAEGTISTMPLGQSGSNVRSGWGGALIDFYTGFGRFSPLIGLSLGGGQMRRLYVGYDESTSSDSTVYNASSTQSSFFYLDPYIGFEVANNSDKLHIIVRIDYMLPFGTTKGIQNIGETFQWSNFISPSGPRLYIGLLFNHNKRR